MQNNSYSWRSYNFLILSVVVSLSMVLLDPISVATTEQVGTAIIMFIPIGTLISIILAILTFVTKNEKKHIAFIALFVTLINVGIIAFFLVLGGSFA